MVFSYQNRGHMGSRYIYCILEHPTPLYKGTERHRVLTGWPKSNPNPNETGQLLLLVSHRKLPMMLMSTVS